MDFSKAAILAIVLFAAWINLDAKPWETGRVIHDDIISYYCYLPAAILHHDLTFTFTQSNRDFYADKYWPQKTPEGRDVVKMTMGLAFLYLPFFLTGHAAALIGGAVPDGYSFPYLIALQMSALFYLLAGLIILRSLLVQWFKPRIVGIVLLATFFGTNMMHYCTLEATMSHGYSFFLYALFFLLTVKFWESPEVKHWVFLGLLAGWITLIRPTNALVVLFFLLWNVDSMQTLKDRFAFFSSRRLLVLLAFVLAVAVWVPQLLYWKSATGSWLCYSYNNEGFFFLNPHILDGLLSYRKGWLLYSPVVIIPLAGIALFAVKKKFAWFWPLAIFMLVNIYIIFSWWSWWYGGGLGARPLIESYAFLSLPFCYALQWMDQKTGRQIIGYAVILMLTAYGLFDNFQYRYGAIHWDAMTQDAYRDSFLRLRPSERFHDLLQTPDYSSAIAGKDERHRR